MHRFTHQKSVSFYMQVLHFFIKSLSVLLFCFSSFIAEAQSSSSPFDIGVTYDQTTGKLIIHAYSWAETSQKSVEWVEKGIVSFSVDGTNYSPFYEYSFERWDQNYTGRLKSELKYPGYTMDVQRFGESWGWYQEITLYLKNPYQNI